MISRCFKVVQRGAVGKEVLTSPLIGLFFFIVAQPAFPIRAIRQWRRASFRIDTPVWRSYFAIGAIILVGLSGLLLIVSTVWATASGGEPDNPAFIWIFWLGFLPAPTGLLASLFGKETFRWRALALAGVMTALWILWGLQLALD
jgi:hypothetical protein